MALVMGQTYDLTSILELGTKPNKALKFRVKV